MEKVEIVEVRTKKQQKEFIEYPLRLYKDSPYFVPPLYGDEKRFLATKTHTQKPVIRSFFLRKAERKR